MKLTQTGLFNKEINNKYRKTKSKFMYFLKDYFILIKNFFCVWLN